MRGEIYIKTKTVKGRVQRKSIQLQTTSEGGGGGLTGDPKVWMHILISFKTMCWFKKIKIHLKLTQWGLKTSDAVWSFILFLHPSLSQFTQKGPPATTTILKVLTIIGTTFLLNIFFVPGCPLWVTERKKTSFKNSQ